MEATHIIDFDDSKEKIIATAKKVIAAAGLHGLYTVFPSHHTPDRFLRLTPGVRFKGFTYVPAEKIELKQRSKQSRLKGVCPTNKKQVKNQIIAEGQKYPIFCTVDPVSGKLILEHGHHRYYACREEGLWIAVWIIEFVSREDGLDARAEFNQFQNKKEAHKGHDKDDALHYLNTVKELPGYFSEQCNIQDESEKKKALKDRANGLLQEHYSHLSPQTRGSIVNKFLKGVVQSKVDNIGAKDVARKFEDNNWAKLNTYDFVQNELCYLIQMGKEGNYVGMAEDMLRREYLRTLEEIDKNGAFSKFTPEDIREYYMNTTISVVAYTNSATDGKGLNKARKSFLKVMKGINLDTIFSPHTTIKKIMFNPQLLMPTEEKVPVRYEWDENKRKFVPLS